MIPLLFSSLLPHLLQIIKRTNVSFSKMHWYFRVFKFSIFTTNNTIDFFDLNLFRIYWKYFSIISSFISYLFGENKLVYSNKLLPFYIKSINQIQKYLHIIELYASISKIVFRNWFTTIPIQSIQWVSIDL